MKLIAIIWIAALLFGCATAPTNPDNSVAFPLLKKTKRHTASTELISFRPLGQVIKSEKLGINTSSIDNLQLANEVASELAPKLTTKLRELSFNLPLKVVSMKKKDGNILLKVRVLVIEQHASMESLIVELTKSSAKVSDFSSSFNFNPILIYKGKDGQTYSDPELLEYEVSQKSELFAKQFIESSKNDGGISCPANIGFIDIGVNEKLKQVWASTRLEINFSADDCELKL